MTTNTDPFVECERLSQCCGRPEHYAVPGMCGCGDWTGFECNVHDCLWEDSFADCPLAGTPLPVASVPPSAVTPDTGSESALALSGETTVVHVSTPHDVYIGRGSEWGNPYRIGADGSRADVIRKYRAHIQGRAHLMARLGELLGKRLGCYCYPRACHGDVLVRLVKQRYP